MSNPTDPTPADLPPLPPPPPPADDAVPMALTDLDDFPVADAVGFDVPDLPAGDRTIGVPMADLPDLFADDLPPLPAVSPGESWADVAGAVQFDPPAGLSPTASSSALFADAPPARLVPPPEKAGVSASSLFGESVPAAEPASGFPDVPEAVAAGDSGVNVAAALPVDPVSPASGWFTPPDEPAPVAEAVPFDDGIEAELAGPLPATGHGEGSDIFASAPPPGSRLLGEQSDVITATSWRDAEPVVPPAAKGGGRPSEVALTFDQPPGGSTIQEPADDLPVADDVDDVPESESLFGDSATLAHTPPLPGADDAPDFGGAVYGGADASSILADLSEPAGPLTDGSAIRIEAPGIDPTLSREHDLPAALRGDDQTEADDAPPGYANLWDAGGPADPQASPISGDDEVDLSAESGSDLFAGSRPAAPRSAGPRFELTPDVNGMVDPFDGVDEGEEPSLASAPSSIFTTPVAPLSGLSGPPAAEPDAVDFSDHPDPSFAAAAVEFDLADDGTYPDRTSRSPIPEDDALDLTDPDRAPPKTPSTGDVLAAAAGQGAGLDWLTGPEADATEAVGPAGPRSRARSPRPAVDLTDPGVQDPGFVPEPAAPARGGSAPRPAVQPSTGSVELDWVTGNSTNEMILAEPSRGQRPGRRTPAPDDDDDTTGSTSLSEPAAGGGLNRSAAGGMLIGFLLCAGISSGAYFSGVLDKGGASGPVAVVPKTDPGTGPGVIPPAPVGPVVTVADARAAIDAGDPARALKAIEAAGATTPEAKAARGQARLLARLREATAPAADDAALKDARADLEAVVNDADAAKTADGEKAAVRAAVHLGLTHELAGDRAKAREVYAGAATKFPKAADVFQSALDRLDATAPPAAAPAGAGTSLRLTPADAERLAVAAAFLFLQDAPAPAAAEPAEAGTHFWRAANHAAAGKYADAADAIARAKTAHVARARALAGRGLNPLTDPLEQIFPRTCDDLKAYWELRRTLYEHKGVGAEFRAAGKDVGKALDGFAKYQGERDIAFAEAKLAGVKLDAAQKGLLAEQEALKTEKAALKAEKESGLKLTDDLKKEKAAALQLTKDVEAAKVALTKTEDATKKLTDAHKEMVKSLTGDLLVAEKGRREATDTLAGVATELKAAKLLPEKHSPAELVAAAKSAASRATGPDLTSLIPPGMAGAVGAPVTTGTLVDLASRAGKLDAAAKQATADLAAANAKFKTDFAKSKTDYDTAMKAATDAHATALKKAADDAGAVLTKTKADAATDLAKAKADATAAVTKLNADHKAATTALEKKLADDATAAKAALAASEAQFRARLSDVVTPAEALPLWLPLLVELRRPADADPALAAADRVLKTAAPATDDFARAHTVAGLALLLKNDVPAARARLDAAKRSPAYAPTKDWGRAADVGLASLSDPAAASRVAVEPVRPGNPTLAARSLDAGIAAYNAGNYAAAERALADAAWHNDADPLAWYFLGAAKWATGKPDAARDDFRQGAKREKDHAIPGRVVSARLAPVQGPVRAALDALRP